CRQLGLDRIIRFDLSTWKDRCFMYVRLWSGAANVIVTDTEGKILDCMFRRPKKGEVTGGTFLPEEKVPSEEERAAALERFPVRSFDDLPGQRPGEQPEAPGLSFNEQIDLFYSQHAASLSRESLLAQAEKWYTARRSKMTAALEKLEQKQKDFEHADRLKHTGDLILTYATQAAGSCLDCEDYETGQQVHIRLDPKLSAQENAAVYYEQYKKASSGLEALAHDIQLSRKAIAALDAQYAQMQNEQNTLKIEQLLRHDTAPRQSARQKAEKPHPGLHYEIHDWTIMVGRTAAENDELLRHYVRGSDLWMHTRDFAGGYVFVKARKGKTVPLDIMLYAGNLAVYHSKARQNAQADLYYTEVKYLRRAKDGPKGLVIPTQEKNLFIRLDEKKLRELDEYEKGL
ncbi:MAG: DUF814 domain-containing protein, partial [Treponema sp.]|nr:DUF814 domain-containing protein [Treponema sp.]